jgi:hypothetical protein
VKKKVEKEKKENKRGINKDNRRTSTKNNTPPSLKS